MTGATLALPLFPLPDVVHFPRTDLRLHVFEPRYRRLVRDLMERPEEERLIGVVLLQHGTRATGDGNPPIYAQGTAALLTNYDALADGRSNILLRGEFRFRIEEEFPSHPYRQARVRPQQELPLADSEPEVAAWRAELLELLDFLSRHLHAPSAIEPPRGGEIALERVVNELSAGLDIPVLAKLDLLSRELPERTSRILSILRSRKQVLELLAPFRPLHANPELN